MRGGGGGVVDRLGSIKHTKDAAKLEERNCGIFLFMQNDSAHGRR